MKSILFAVTGHQPAVVTHALGSLLSQGNPMPERIVVLSRSKWSDEELARITAEISAFYTRSGITPVRLERSDIIMVEEGDKQTLLQTLASVCRDEQCRVMAAALDCGTNLSSQLNVAMSLFGREQDQFYFMVQAGKSRFSLAMAQVDYPLIREMLPQPVMANVIEGLASMAGDVRDRVQMRVEPQRCEVHVGGTRVKLTPKLFAFYYWMLRREEQGEQELTIHRDFEEDTVLVQDYLRHAFALVTDPRFYETFGVTREDVAEECWSGLTGMDRKYVEQCRSNLKRKFRELLPEALVDKLMIKGGRANKVHRCWLRLAANDIDVELVA